MLDERIAALGNHVKVIGSYKGITKKTTFQCNDCGNILEIWYNDFNSIEYIINNYINNLKYPVTTTVA